MALSPDQVGQTGDWLASCQLPDGMVPWYQGGHGDPWNHTEAAMALAVAGRWAEVERCFSWLAEHQLPDGSWCTSYVDRGVTDPRRDPNVCAYVATGAWWCAQLSGPGGAALMAQLWPMVDRALSWCLTCQRPGGEVVWSVGPDGVPGTFALLTANSSLQHSLRNGAQLAEALGHERPHWLHAADRVVAAVEHKPGCFAPKQRWAMDWYYPVLSGALEGDAARGRLSKGWPEFVMEGLGVRCVHDRPWVTTAETAECAMAANRAGMAGLAWDLLAWAGHLRDEDGSYWTGCVHPECVRFPGGQTSTYSAAAVLIADHVISGRSAAAEVFGGVPSTVSPSTVSSLSGGSSDTAQGDRWAEGEAARALAAALRPDAIHAGTPAPS